MASSIDPLHPAEAQQRQRTTLLRWARGVFLVLILTIALVAAIENPSERVSFWVPPLIAAAIFVATLLVDLATPNKKVGAIAGAFTGLLVGLLAALVLSLVFDLLAQTFFDAAFDGLTGTVGLVKLLVGAACCYLGVTTVLQTQDDFRLVIPYVEFSKQIRGERAMLLDSSVLIDSRIVDLCETGLVQSPLIVPEFIVAELQALSDSSDRLKRERGRRGLDVVAKLQRLPLDVAIEPEPVGTLGAPSGADQRLIELAQEMQARIATTDAGLDRVARIRGVEVLNLHDVAAALRPSFVAGEALHVRLIRPGEQAGQAVGYLPDGTMVVAEDSRERVGEEVALEVTSVLQTSAGRLVFAQLAGRGEQNRALPAPASVADRVGTPDPTPESSEAAEEPTNADAAGGGTTRAEPEPEPAAQARTGDRSRGPIGPSGPRRRGAGHNPRR